MNVSQCLSSHWPGFNYWWWQSISRKLFLADHTLPTRTEPVWQKMAQFLLNGTKQPVGTEEEGHISALGRQWLTKFVSMLAQWENESISLPVHVVRLTPGFRLIV